MEDCLHTSSENLSKLVRWAHSHGTICALIPNLKHLLTEGSHGNLTAMWGCSAGHAYHWPLPATCKTGQKERGGCYQDSRSINSDSLSVQGGASARQSSPGGERFLGRSTKAKGVDSSQTRDSCDFSNCSDDNTEADDNTEEYNSNLFDIVCESSATTDEDGDVDYEPRHRSGKRGPPGGMPGPQRPGSEDRGQGDKSVKKIKQETAEDYYTVPKAQLAAGVGTDSGLASHSVSQSPKPNNSLSHYALPHKPSQLDADGLVGGVSSFLLGRSFPHKPLRGSVSKPSMMSTGSPRHQDLSSVSTQGLSTLPGAGSELMEDLLKPGGSEGPLGNLTPSSPSGMNPDLDLLGAETKGEATDVFWPTSSSHCLTSETAEERRRVEEFVASIDLGQLQSLQTVIQQVLSFREKKTERVQDWRTETGQDWRTERGEERRGEDWRTERGEERRMEDWRTERGEERRMERGEDWRTERGEERRGEDWRTERGQFHEARASSHYPQPHTHQPNTHQQQSQPQLQSHLETHQLQLQPQPEPPRWRGRHREQLQGQQELYPGSGVLLSSLQLAAMFQEARENCMRLFHLLFEHFFTEEDLVGAVAFGRRGKVPDGKKILDRRTVDAIIVGPALCEIERLRALLSVERNRSEQMGETISSLKQDKELLQQELTKKAELICDFLQDQLRPEKRRGLSSSQMELGTGSSSHMGVGFPDEGVAFENPALFDSFEEVELHRVMNSSKRSRDGENTRVRMKNVVGVIARYMAALQEFRRSVSMKVAFDRVGVDRNTISRTAAIAELSLAAPEVFHALPPWDEKEETLAHYAHRCRQAMDDTIRAKIKTMKTKGDLLPIVSK